MVCRPSGALGGVKVRQAVIERLEEGGRITNALHAAS
jgi:hypothetical protein